MSEPKIGIVVEHKESGVRYAVLEEHYDTKLHKRIRDLKPGETVLGYVPRYVEPLGDQDGETSGAGSPGAAGEPSEQQATKTADLRTPAEKHADEDAAAVRAQKTEGSAK